MPKTGVKDPRAVEIGRRLTELAERDPRFGSIYKLAKAMGKSYNNLYFYSSGRRLIGYKLQAELRALGLDVEYIMSGESGDASPPGSNAVRESTRGYNGEIDELKERLKEQDKIIDALRGILAPEVVEFVLREKVKKTRRK